VIVAEGRGYRLLAQHDLGPLLRLDRWRDRALRLAGPVADALGLARWPLFANMIGGNALTQAYRRRHDVLPDGGAAGRWRGLRAGRSESWPTGHEA
jgi:hypothetical protein